VCAACALLSNVQILVKVNNILIWAGFQAVTATGALCGINNDQRIVTLIDSAVRARRHAGGIVAVHTKTGTIMDLNLRHCAADLLVQLEPEMSDFRLRFCYRHPVVGNMLVLTTDLTAVATVTFRGINQKYFLTHYFFPLSTHAEDFSPAARSYSRPKASG